MSMEQKSCFSNNLSLEQKVSLTNNMSIEQKSSLSNNMGIEQKVSLTNNMSIEQKSSFSNNISIDQGSFQDTDNQRNKSKFHNDVEALDKQSQIEIYDKGEEIDYDNIAFKPNIASIDFMQ